MTTDTAKKEPKQELSKKKEKKSNFDFFFAGGNSTPITNVMKALNSVDLNSSEAEENAHSISDNNGGRIELNEDDKNIIKK